MFINNEIILTFDYSFDLDALNKWNMNYYNLHKKYVQLRQTSILYPFKHNDLCNYILIKKKVIFDDFMNFRMKIWEEQYEECLDKIIGTYIEYTLVHSLNIQTLYSILSVSR